MPSYELSFLLRTMTKPDIVSSLKRTAQEIFDRGGLLRKIENLGTKATPYRMSAHGLVHREASYFIMQFDAKPRDITDLLEVYKRDVDIIRRRIYKLEEKVSEPCTIHEENKPPAYRKDVQEMIEIGKKKHKPTYNHNTGLDYSPFQK